MILIAVISTMYLLGNNYNNKYFVTLNERRGGDDEMEVYYLDRYDMMIDS